MKPLELIQQRITEEFTTYVSPAFAHHVNGGRKSLGCGALCRTEDIPEGFAGSNICNLLHIEYVGVLPDRGGDWFLFFDRDFNLVHKQMGGWAL